MSLRDKALELKRKGYFVWEIASILNISEAKVVKLLGLD